VGSELSWDSHQVVSSSVPEEAIFLRKVKLALLGCCSREGRVLDWLESLGAICCEWNTVPIYTFKLRLIDTTVRVVK